MQPRGEASNERWTADRTLVRAGLSSPPVCERRAKQSLSVRPPGPPSRAPAPGPGLGLPQSSGPHARRRIASATLARCSRA
jgi:hypothetical protein